MDRALAAMLFLTRWTAFPLNHDSKSTSSTLVFQSDKGYLTQKIGTRNGVVAVISLTVWFMGL